jgi:hypothetical protein
LQLQSHAVGPASGSHCLPLSSLAEPWLLLFAYRFLPHAELAQGI